MNKIFVRAESEHIHQQYDLQSTEMKIVDEQGTNIIGQFDMKKGAKYNVQIDLNEDLAERYEEKDR